MRTLSKRKSSVSAHIFGNMMNFVMVLLAFTVFMAGLNHRSHVGRVVSEEKVDRLPEAEYQYPDPSTLSFIDNVDEVEETVTPEILELAKGIYFEARSEDYEGQVRVAKAILKRVADPRWPDTIQGVIRQGEERRNRCQFSFMCDGQPEHIKNKRAWAQALSIAHDVYREWQEGADMGCAHSYRATYVTSQKALAWFATLKPDTQVGAHIFYCDKNA